MNISLIGAMGKNRELGYENKLPWKLPDDMKKFKALTEGHAVVMGRKTYEAISRPLPDRKNIIVTRNQDYAAPGCIVKHSLEEAFKEAAQDDPQAEIFVIGGGDIYKAALPYANKIYLTLVEGEFKADAYFPEFNEKEWKVVQTEPHMADDKHTYNFTFKVFEKIVQ